LGTPPGTLTAGALDINKQGLIAGLITIPSPNLGLDSYRAVLFVNGQGTILGLPKGALGNAALAINDLGDVAGDAYYTAGGDGQVRAFLSVQGKLWDIGVLRGDVISNATGINNSRQVVGISQDLVGEPRAFLYSGGQMYDLNDLVKRDMGWHFRAAFAINNRGQIVGEALFEGVSRPFLVTPVGYDKD
jgi:probable HAF family extracellular repeat protein